MKPHPRDTTDGARDVQFAAYRAMTGERRAALAMQLSDEMRAVTIAGIRHRNPTLDDEGVRRELLRILHGAELAGELMKMPVDDNS